MPEVQSSPYINPTIEKPKRNWKKILLILIIDSKKTPERIITNTDTDIYAMNPDGSGEIKIFDLEPADNTSNVSEISLSYKNTYLSWRRDKSIFYIKPSRTTQKTSQRIGPLENIMGYAFSPDEKKLAILIGGERNTKVEGERVVKILEIPTGKQINEFKTIKESILLNESIIELNLLKWLDDETIITIGNDKNRPYLASYLINKGLRSEKRLVKPVKDLHSILAINLSKTEIAYVVQDRPSASQGSEDIWLANINESNKKVVSSLSLGSIVQDLRFSPDGNWLAVASNNAESTQFQLLDLSSNEIIGGESAALGNLVWSPDSKKLVVADGVYANKLVTVGLDGNVIKELTSLSGLSNEVGSVSRYGLVGWVE